MTIKIYVEGGGDSKSLHSQCRHGFKDLLENCGFRDRMPKVVACGGRGKAFDMFETSLREGDGSTYPILLVDSEEIVSGSNYNPNSTIAWDHLLKSDKLARPTGATNVQAQLMTTCMETWIMADHSAIISFFGPKTIKNALLPTHNLETRDRHQVLDILVHATANCGRDKSYDKGRRSFGILSLLNPQSLQTTLPHFCRFTESLNQILN